MRIATLQLQGEALRELSRHRSEITHAQRQIGTGSRITRPADDPLASARVVSLERDVIRLEQFQRNATLARGRLGLLDTTLGQASNLLQAIREVTLQAINATLSNEDRAGLAVQVRALTGQLLELANTTDEGGEYVFAGLRSALPPFAVGASGVTYQGDLGNREVQLGETVHVQVSEAGAAVFSGRSGNQTFVVSADSGNGGTGVIDVGTVVDAAAYTSSDYRIVFTTANTYDVVEQATGTVVLGAQPYAEGASIAFAGIETRITGMPQAGDRFLVEPSRPQSVFTTLQRLADTLETPVDSDPSEARLHQDLQGVLGDMRGAMASVRAARSSVGVRLQAVESQGQASAAGILHAETARADAAGLDYAEAISRLSSRIQLLESAQQSFIRIQNLSLFRFLR